MGTSNNHVAGNNTSHIISFYDTDGSVEASATLEAATSTGFSLNWDVNDNDDLSGTRYIVWKLCL